MTLDQILDLGFDKSFADIDEDSGKQYVHVRCSQCEALVINGVPTHEKGCPNSRKKRDDDYEDYLDDILDPRD